MNYSLDAGPEEMPGAQSFSVIGEWFEYVGSEEMDRILMTVSLAIC